ncbi:hypothetical protein PUV54_13990 [Hyphococcus flavus]|uniref:Uncharacterized protein n=1 Tax=Hyphococcus flavus TaxID=1866326 RepID=A0AAF0CGT0_9PROT|nr:hypothetical protein [Hyphococcus flavus]WDI31062.1 hypothetical protein PUV54_13990 [Hyphococcus flavus]
MVQGSSNIEVNILGEDYVRQYVNQEDLPDSIRKSVEQMLIDDERARALARKLSNSKPIRISWRLQQHIRFAIAECCAVLSDYMYYSQKAGGSSLLERIAAECAERRMEILSGLYSLMPDAPRRESNVDISPRQMERIKLEGPGLRALLRRDRTLKAVLERAFEEVQQPLIKTRIADWIAAIEGDQQLVRWLERRNPFIVEPQRTARYQ